MRKSKLSLMYEKSHFSSASMPPKFIFPIRNHCTETTEDASLRASYVIPYAKSFIREIIFWILSFGTFGIFPLILSWFPFSAHKARYCKTADILSADRIVVLSETNQKTVVKCRTVTLRKSEYLKALPSLAHYQDPSVSLFEKEIRQVALSDKNTEITTIVFNCRCLQFILNIWSGTFEPLSFDLTVSPDAFHNVYGRGVSCPTVLQSRQQLYGSACVEVPIQPLYALIAAEIFHPFYIFQVAAVSLWIWDEYYQYAGAIIVITVVSLFIEIFEVRRSQLKLRRMARFVCDINVVREHGPLISQTDSIVSVKHPCHSHTVHNCMETVQSTKLVPGDVVQIVKGMTVPCDMLLLQGSILINESMLTGESVPVVKVPVPILSLYEKSRFDIHQNSGYILYGGTDVITTRKIKNTNNLSKHHPFISSDIAVALVIRTGFCTVQGQMMRSIIHPSPNDRLHFKSDTYKFLGVLALFACCGAGLSLYLSCCQHLHWEVVVIRALDTFPNAIPPSLCAAMAVGCSIAVTKLRTFWKILCIAPSRVNTAGQVNTLIFDKTGTLTEEGLELEGVLYSRHPIKDYDLNTMNKMSSNTILSSITDSINDVPAIFKAAMASCHSVMVVDDCFSGEPMEIQLLKFTGWKLSEDNHFHEDQSISDHSYTNSLESMLPCLFEVSELKSYITNRSILSYRIVKRYDFSPSLRRMSVIAWDKTTSTLHIFCKGAPEQLILCCESSTLPSDFSESLRRYTENGMRVLAFGYKSIPLPHHNKDIPSMIEQYSRDEAETNLIFLGISMFNNMLKKETRESIRELRSAGCRCLMATGDNALTALAVAKDAGLIDSDQANIVILGDIVKVPLSPRNHHSICDELNSAEYGTQLFWSPILYSPTVDSLNQDHNKIISDITPNKVLQDATAISKSSVVDTFDIQFDSTSLSYGEEDAGDAFSVTEPADCGREIVITLNETVTNVSQLTPLRTDLLQGQYSSRDIFGYLNGKDPRQIVLVLTGPAFRALKLESETIDSKINTKFSSNTSKSDPSDFSILTDHRIDPTSLLHDIEADQLVPLNNQFCSQTPTPGILRIALYHDESSSNIQYPSGKTNSYVESTILNENPHTLLSTNLLQYYKQQQQEQYCHSSQFINSDKCIQSSACLNTFGGINYTVSHINLSLFEYCLRYCRVYARMSPDDKASLVTAMRALPEAPLIGMCGDGANDCSALRIADLGLSLSDKEASIAAPFTSARKSVKSAVDLLREARSALVNSFQSFKFIALYAMVQLSTSISLYYYGGNFSDEQYTWTDLLVVLPLSMTMAWTHSSSKLSTRMPLRRLFAVPVVLSLVGQILIQIIFVVGILIFLSHMPFYERFSPDPDTSRFDAVSLKGHENTVVFLVSNFQYISTNIALSSGRPWRKHTITNPFYSTIAGFLICVSIMLILCPYNMISSLSHWLSIVDFPEYFRLLLLMIIFLNSLATFMFEKYIIRKWAVEREENADMPCHWIDMKLPLDKNKRVLFENIVE